MATTAKSVILRDKDDGKQLLPMTRAELVIRNDGTSVETSLANKQDTLVPGTNIKTINGESLLGGGDLIITGRPGSDGVGISSVVQTTESTESGGTNVITVTNTDGTTSTFKVRNGEKGNKGDKGNKGETGATGPAGASGVASSDGIASINDLLATVPDDTASTVYVAGAKEVKSINDVIRVDKAEVGEDNLYDGQKYTGAPWTGFISQDYIDFYASPETTYVISLGVNESPQYNYFAFFDSSDNYISNTTRVYSNGVATVTTVANTAKVRVTVSNISTLVNCCIRKGTEAGEWMPHKYLKGYAHQTEVDEISDTLKNITNTVSFNTKNLDKKYFGTRYSGAPWSGFVQCGYIDIPREYFGERVYAWFTDPNNAATTLGFFGTVDSNGTVVHSPGTTYTSKAGSLFGTYRLFVWQLISDDIKFIRFTLYHGDGDFTEAMVDSLFIGSDLDAEYETFPWINERTVPPVTRDWYSGENEQIKSVENKYPMWSSELLGLSKTRNLFNNDQHTYRLDEVTTAEPYYPGMVSDFIPVNASTTYCVSDNGVANNQRKVYFYTSDKAVISNTLYSVHTTPSNCAYVRISLSNYNTWTAVSNEVKIQYEQASAPTVYISPYTYTGEVSVLTTPLTGKTFATIGDSFTILGWPNTTAEKTGMTLLSNQAVSGARWTTYPSINSAYQQAQALVSGGYNPDYILVFLGCNDVENFITLGDIVYSTTISDFDQTTFTGGMQACLNYLETNFPDAIIKVGYTPAGGTTFWQNTLSRDTYLDRMREVCRLYQVQYLDVTLCQMSMAVSSNVTYHYGAGDMHPSSAGSERIGEFIARLLLSNM